MMQFTLDTEPGRYIPGIIFMRKIKPEERIITSIPEYKGSGIYIIRNIVNGKVYIGSAKHINKRIKEHDQYMRRGWCNNKIQEDIDKGHTFTCEILEKCDNMMFVELRNREKYYVEKYDSLNSGYNTAPVPVYDLDYFIKRNDKRMIEYLTRRV